jgi:predicted dehydrogenase
MAIHERVRIGLIGAGGICRTRHLPGLKKIEGVEVTVVANRSEASSREVASQFGIGAIEKDWRRLLAREDVDAVFIGTWPYMHSEMSIAALQAGKHVFCQARMAMDLAQAKAMCMVAQAHRRLVNMVCPPPTRMPFEPYIRRVLAEGELGELREVRAVCVNNADLGELTWRERVEYSGKQIMLVGIVAETLNAWVGEYETVTAQMATPIGSKVDAAGQAYTVRIPQIVNVAGKLRGEVVASEHHSGISPHEQEGHVSLYGSQGTLRVELGQTIAMAKVGEAMKAVEVPAELRNPWMVEQEFIDAVRAARRGEGRPRGQTSPDFAEALGYMKKVEAIHLSAQRGCAVKLDEL